MKLWQKALLAISCAKVSGDAGETIIYLFFYPFINCVLCIVMHVCIFFNLLFQISWSSYGFHLNLPHAQVSFRPETMQFDF